ncbi:hypothetical protein TRAPUB_5357 [Trametes pubescens]|uniref:Uncharacterized protein n=1 Tax=Trametes pubescens TaxID=154538 RepID=A0A1M2V8U4_TRAPU|nr:hypothetical protein TRAPUB_5357 [Trametes pubescens]
MARELGHDIMRPAPGPLLWRQVESSDSESRISWRRSHEAEVRHTPRRGYQRARQRAHPARPTYEQRVSNK